VPDSFSPVTLREACELIAAQWNARFPDSPKSPDELALEYEILEPGTHVEAWRLRSEVCMILSGIDASVPLERCTGIMSWSTGTHPDTLNASLDFAEARSRSLGATLINLWSASIEEEWCEVLVSAGYRVIQTVPQNFLNLQECMQLPTERQDEIRFCTIANLEAEGVDWVPLLYESTWEISLDVPNPYSSDRLTLDQYRVLLQKEAIYKLDLMFVAMDGARIVGYTRLTPHSVRPDLVSTGLSGVVRSHRRRGIMLGLKLWSIQVLKKRGYALLKTENDETNPMYQINLAVGFEKRWDWLQWEKAL
jgi:hypothetical protein